jgi:hypothetical protein
MLAAGQRFGRLGVLREAEPQRTTGGAIRRMVAVVCDCGTRKVVRLDGLVGGDEVSCGCLKRERAAGLSASR